MQVLTHQTGVASRLSVGKQGGGDRQVGASGGIESSRGLLRTEELCCGLDHNEVFASRSQTHAVCVHIMCVHVRICARES